MSTTPELVRIVVVGAGGRLGRTALEAAAGAPGLEVVLQLGRQDDVSRALSDVVADVALDATVAGQGFQHALWMLEAGLAPIVGTSGVRDDELEQLDSRARALGLAALVVPNFSLGVLLLKRAARDFAQHFPNCEIVERHHATKRDAPSATARAIARTLAAQGLDNVPIHSVRLPGHYAHHELTFGRPGETLTLRHDMSSPAAFGPGIVCALRGVRDLSPGVHVGLESVWKMQA